MTNPGDLRKLVSKVNSSPRGLQDLLGNVNQGINPHELDHRISPVVDLYPHWSVNRLLAEFKTEEIAGTVGQGTNIEVPEGELWQVVAAECAYENSSSQMDDTSLSVGVLDPSLAKMVSFYTDWTLNAPGTAGTYQVVGGPFPDRFILSGGWNIRGQVNGSNQAVARTMNVKCLYIKLTE